MSNYTGDGSEFIPIDRPPPQFTRETCPHKCCAGIGDDLYCVGCHAPWKEVATRRTGNGMAEVAAAITAAVIGLDVQRVLKQALLGKMRTDRADGSEAGVLARRIYGSFREHGVELCPRVHVAVQLREDLRTVTIAFIRVRTGEWIRGDVSDVISVAQPGAIQANLDRLLDDRVGAQPVRWCGCGAQEKPAAGHEMSCPLMPFESW